MSQKKSKLDQEALAFHANGRPGKLEITATKPLMSQHDLSLAYSPGVAAPCLAIEADPDTAYDYTAKGNVIAVISNGTAVLGLGDIGAAASKPGFDAAAPISPRPSTACLLYTSPSPRDRTRSRMPSSA